MTINEYYKENFYTKLDLVLKYYVDNFTPKIHVDKDGFMFECLAQDDCGIDHDLWLELKEKLVSDGYFEYTDMFNGRTKNDFSITNNGKLFWDNGRGGYVNREKHIQEEVKRRINVDRSVVSTNKSVENSSVHQKRIGYFALFVAMFSSWVAYKQMVNDKEVQMRELTKEQETAKIQLQIDKINSSLNSVHDSLTSNTTSKKK